jgi:hypothetical protein
VSEGAEPALVEIEAGSAQRFELAGGQALEVLADGRQGGDLSFAGFDQALTRNINGHERYGRPYLVFHLQAGMSMYDGDGDPALELLALESEGALDIMLPGCWREMYPDGRPGCRDLIAAALQIPRAQLTGMASFFVRSAVTEEYYDALGASALKAGDRLVLGALRATAVAVSACPDSDLPGWSRGCVRARILDAAPAVRLHG